MITRLEVQGYRCLKNVAVDLTPIHVAWIRKLSLRNPSRETKILAIDLTNGMEARAPTMSEGILYFLAFAALSEITRPSVFLVEEPENGLHPSRIREVVQMLRAIAEDPKNPAQVLIATQSPLVINELKPEEVTVVTRTAEAGTIVTPIAKTPNFAARLKVYELGELWLSYADGVAEKDLLEGVEA